MLKKIVAIIHIQAKIVQFMLMYERLVYSRRNVGVGPTLPNINENKTSKLYKMLQFLF